MAKKWFVRCSLAVTDNFVVECDDPNEALELAQEKFADYLDLSGMECDVQECDELTKEQADTRPCFISVT